MIADLLHTKLNVPPLQPSLVPRPHLIERLNQSLQLGHKLTLLPAPAGYGKSTLVVDWLSQQQNTVAWLSLDDNDDDPQCWEECHEEGTGCNKETVCETVCE